MSDSGEFQWTVVVLTCQHKDSVYAFQRELELRQQRGSLSPGSLVLTVRDRQEPLGSGGATLNALLVAAEHLSSRAGHTVVTADVLDDAHILILHTGRDFPWSSCSRAFDWLPAEAPGPVQAPLCVLDLVLVLLREQVCPGSPPGVWVCSTDAILHLPQDLVLSWEGFSGVRVLALPGDVSYAADHGVYLSDAQGQVTDIVYRGTEEQIQQAVMHDGKVPLVSGPVFFSRSVSEKLLQSHVSPPLDGCTYLGLDSGAPPLQISLFLDVLRCLCSDLTQDQFVNEDRPGCSSAVGPQGALVRSGRAELWRILRGEALSLVYVPGGRYDYLTLSGRGHVERLSRDWTNKNTLSHIERESLVGDGGRVINSVLEGDVTVATGAVVQHCHLQGPLVVPSGCLLSGLDLMTSRCIRQLVDDIIIQGHRMELGELRLNVFTVTGALDQLEVSFDDSTSSFLNQSWSFFFSRTGIQPEELWVRGGRRCLMEARLFPVLSPRGGAVGEEGGVCWLMGGAGGGLGRWREAWRLSLKEVLSLTCQEAELRWREELLFLGGRRRVREELRGRSHVCLLPCFRAAVQGGQQGALLQTLDSIAAGSSDQGAEPGLGTESGAALGAESTLWAGLGVGARCLSCIADVLVIMAGGRGGLRSGPAANEAWSHAYSLLEEGDLRGGVKALAAQRDHWLSRPDLLVRAARHYEGAGQVLLRRAVMSSQRFISIGQGEAPPLGEWQEVECPARLDLAGGWSDTPPIAFEHGGSVTNVAVRVDGRRPIGARARRIPEPRLLLVSHSGGRDSGVSTETACDSLDDLRDYCQPHAPGALLKAVCVCSGLVSLSSQHALGEQLMQR
ncbi:LOW QUALITY PROTEIN: L-fucose kinase, partial [Trematomus bernacchii]|uniref:LOW QUALITY PROTEIN: L-fucose kinase n=1 Tax=Trematomus bernacchii TaxID=40690 RepID=UPI00146A289E